jgi:hypothetical protein
MNKNLRMWGVYLILISMTMSGCSGLARQWSDQSGANLSATANGERIYFTGIDRSGQQISYTGGPGFGGMMMGSYLTCASCHGPEAKGGQHAMGMREMYAPPITGKALTEMQMEESGGPPSHEGYNLESFRLAVVEGKHPDGDMLNRDMPRWRINDQDLADLLAFLESLSN